MQSLGRDVAVFLKRFAESKATLTGACRTAAEAVQIDKAITMPTLSSQKETKSALERLEVGIEKLKMGTEALLGHRAAAVREFSSLVASLGIAAPDSFIRHFEQRVTQELLLEAEDLASVHDLFKKAASIAQFVQDFREELEFDAVDITFPDQDLCDAYLELIGEYKAAHERTQRAVQAREAYLAQRVSDLSV